MRLSRLRHCTICTQVKAYGWTQTVTVSLNTDAAVSLLKEGRIRIGWVICKIRENNSPSKCFRCSQIGLIARQCKSKDDRLVTSRKYGQEDHIAGNYEREPLSMFCKVDNPGFAKHIAGSRKCPQFQNPLNLRA